MKWIERSRAKINVIITFLLDNIIMYIIINILRKLKCINILDGKYSSSTELNPIWKIREGFKG